MSKYDFTDIENQIEMTASQLKDEMDRYKNQNNKVSTLLTVFGVLFLLVPQIYLFFNNNFSVCGWYVWVFLILYCLGGLISLILFILFLWPSKIPQKSNIDWFYCDLMQQYEAQGYEGAEANKGVQYSYLGHLKECYFDYRKINSKKGNIHYWSYVCIVISLLFYFLLALCVYLQ